MNVSHTDKKIINTHVIDTTTVSEAPSLREIMIEFFALGETSKALVVQEYIYEHELTVIENKNLKAWHSVAAFFKSGIKQSVMGQRHG